MTFHGGEEHVVIEDPELKFEAHVRIFFNFAGSSSILQLLMITDALRRMGVKAIHLYCPYFPGARADRVDQTKNPGEALGVKIYADLLNAQNYERVFIFDPHSFVAPCLIDNCTTISNHQFVIMAIATEFPDGCGVATEDLVLVSPDAGANKKIDDLAKALGGMRIVRADKARDIMTGALVPGACEVFANTLENKTCLIVDDICSKGGTFKPLAAQLRRLGAKNVYLIVSHDEGVSDLDSLREAGITKVITTNSLTTRMTNDFLVVHDVTKFMRCQD